MVCAINADRYSTSQAIHVTDAQRFIPAPLPARHSLSNISATSDTIRTVGVLLLKRPSEISAGEQGVGDLIANVEAQWRATNRFWEYYHAETGEGLGADHQTGWTALVANLIREEYSANQ